LHLANSFSVILYEMRKILPAILLSVFCLSVFSAFAQAPPVFDAQKCLGGTGTDVGNKIIRSSDGGFIIAGSTSSVNGDVSLNHGASDFWLIKTDLAGIPLWQKTFGGTGNDIATSVIELSNNEIVVAGYTFSNNGDVTGNHGLSDVWLIKISSTGNLIWQKTYGGSFYEVCHAVSLCDSGFVLAGASSSSNGDVSGNQGLKDYWIIKTDTAGNLKWQKSLGGSGNDECYAVSPTSDGGFIAAGYSSSNDGDVTGNHGAYDYWVVKLDAAGTLVWQKSLGGTSNEVALAALENSSGDLMIAGYTSSNDGDVSGNHGSTDYWIAWLNQEDGNLLSQHAYGGSNSDLLFDFMPTADNGFILAGGSNSNDFDVKGNHGGEDYWLVKTDSDGVIIWSKSYGGSSNERATSVVQTSDGGFTETGYAYSDDGNVSGLNGGADVWFLKLSCLNPVSGFQIPSDTICINATANLSNTSIHAAENKWLLNDVAFSTNTNESLLFNTLGTYKITLISYTCYAVDTLSKYITVVDYPTPVIASDQSYLCSGGSATLSTGSYDSYLWSNNGTSPTTSINAGGVYSVTVTDHGCSSTASYTINQFANPSFNLGQDSILCSGSSILILEAPDGYQSYLWQNSSTSQSLFVTTPGLYSVTVYDGFCSGSASINVTQVTCPVANFISNQLSICQDACIDFTDLSSNALSWNWYFPGSSTDSSNQQSPTNICYHVPGIYTVTLVVGGASGTENALVRQDYITVNATPDDPTIFANGNFLTSSFASSYQWYLDNTAISGANSQTFIATQSGSYYVVIQDGSGCTAISNTLTVIVDGINDPVEEDGVYIFPNPSKGIFNLSISGDKYRNAEIEITDITGKKIYHSFMESSTGKSGDVIDLQKFANGVYLLKLTNDSATSFRKLVLTK
jgi:hypothetical protein